MTTTREYPTEQLEADRQAGRFICRCEHPAPRRWALYDIVECGHCHHKVLP
jgi:hypothetical protein